MWEKHLDIIEQTLDVSRDFAWLFVYPDDESDQIATDCNVTYPKEILGCWRDEVARGTLAAVPHELVHAWVATAQHKPLAFLREGIAVRMAGTVPQIGSQELTVADLMVTEFPTDRYEAAGHFVAWIMTKYGAESFMVLYRTASHGMTPGEISAGFLRALGKTPEDLVSEYTLSAKAFYPAMGAAACGQGPTVPWTDSAATWLAEGSCADGPFFGFEDSAWWQRKTLEISSPGSYVLDLGGRTASLTRCLTDAADDSELPPLQGWITGDWLHADPLDDLNYAIVDDPGDGWPDVILELDQGTYEVWIERRSHELPNLNDEMSLRKL